jgi:hypothetical protein
MPKKTSTTKQHSPFSFQYAAKFICTSNIPGTSQTSDAFLSGNYQTVVNVHNPHHHSVKIQIKAAFGGRRLISKFVGSGLGPDEVTRFVCRDLREKLKLNLIHGGEGFLVIESTHSIDVIAVYTAGSVGGSVASIDVEQVRERKIS